MTVAGSSQAVHYAQHIGFQSVYDEAVAAESTLAAAAKDVSHWASVKRETAEKILDRQADLAVEERGANSAMSATAFDAHMKGAVRLDPELKSLRGMLEQAAGFYDKATDAVREAELTIRNRTARMTELGGYFQYLAATALLQSNNSHQENSS